MAIRIQLRRDTAANWTSANPVLLAGEFGIETDTLKIKVGNGQNWNSILSYVNTTPSDLVTQLGDYVLVADRGAADGVAALNSSYDLIVPGSSIIIEGSTDNAYETSLVVTDPTADRTITFPDSDGTVVLADGSGNVSISGNLTVNGTTTTVNSTEINVQNTLKFEGATADAFETTLTVVDPTADRTVTFQDASGTVALITNVNNAITTAANDATTKANDAVLSSMSYTDNQIDFLHTAVTGEITTHNADTTSVHGIADTAELATKTYAENAVSTHNSDTTSVHGIADTSALATKTYVDGGISDHNSDSTYVHGIPNTADLATKDYANNAAQNVENQLTDYALKAGTIFTGDITVPTVYSTDLESTGTITANDITIQGDLVVNGTTTTVSSQSLEVTDPIIYIATGNSGNSNDIGFVGHATIDSTYQHMGLVRDASDGIWKLFSGVTTEPTNVIDFSSYTNAPLEVGGFSATAAKIGDVTNVELQYVHGVTSAIQTQIDNANTAIDLKAPKDAPSFTNHASFSGQIRISSSGAYVFSDGSASAPSSGSVALLRKSDGSGLKYNAGGTDYNIASESYVNTAITNFDPVPSQTPISQKTSDYTLSSVSEKDTTIELNSSSSITLTIPNDTAVDFPDGSSLDVINVNSGLVTIAGANGVTVNATPGLKLRTTWSSATLFKRGSNNWVVYGDLKA